MNPYETGSLPTPSRFYSTVFHHLLGLYLLGILVFFLTPSCDASIICVDKHAKVIGQGSGKCWSDPFVDLQEALNLARKDPNIETIWIAKGVYSPSKTYSPINEDGQEVVAGAMSIKEFNPGQTIKGLLKSYSDNQQELNHRLKTFDLVNHVDLIGGFEGQPNPRRPNIDATILDGQLNQSEKAWHVLVAGNDLTLTGVELELKNLTVRNGYANDAPYFPTNFPLRKDQQPRHYHDDGAGLYVFTKSNIKLVNVTFENNSAVSGGAIFVQDGSTLTLEECAFLNNHAIEGQDITIRGGGPNAKMDPNTMTEVFWKSNRGSKNALNTNSVFISDNYRAWQRRPRARISQKD